MKNSFSVPSLDLVAIFDVDAELQPPPPAEETVVLSGSRLSNSVTAGSSFMADRIAYRRTMLGIYHEAFGVQCWKMRVAYFISLNDDVEWGILGFLPCPFARLDPTLAYSQSVFQP